MSRERIFKILLAALIGLILLLIFRFKPSVEGPRHIEKPRIKGSNSVLSGKNFTYEVKDKNILKYTLFAEEIFEMGSEEKELLNPVISIPKKGGNFDKIFARKGTFSPAKNVLRLFEDARIVTADNMTIKSSGFRLTPQNEVVSEGRAEFWKDKIIGSGDILRYDREQRIAYLEGNVNIKSENLLFEATRTLIDLENHNGSIVGPVKCRKDDISISSPSGKILLDSKNTLESLILETPVQGETENFNFSGRNIKFDFEKSKMNEFTLIDDVILVQKKLPKSKMQTKILNFEKGSDNLWHFTAPYNISFERLKSRMECSGGTGIINKGEITSDLKGPIRAYDEKTEISSSMGKLDGNTYEFIGNAQVSTSSGNISAERIIAYKSGEKDAYENVRGQIVGKGGDNIFFSSDKAKISANVYPIRLLENAIVESEDFVLKGSDFSFLSNKRFYGCNGVSMVFKGIKGKIDGYAKEVNYEEEKGNCILTGDPYLLDGDRKLSAKDKITVYFDFKKKVKEIVAEGDAKFEGEDQIASGDRIKYDTELKSGEVYSENEIAEVIEKEPFRRCVGRKISFGEKELEIKGSDNKVSRGKIEGQEVKEKH